MWAIAVELLEYGKPRPFTLQPVVCTAVPSGFITSLHQSVCPADQTLLFEDQTLLYAYRVRTGHLAGERKFSE